MIHRAQLEQKTKSQSAEQLAAMMKTNEGKMLQSTRLLQKQKELAAVQELLDTKTAEFRRRMAECDRKRKILTDKVILCVSQTRWTRLLIKNPMYS